MILDTQFLGRLIEQDPAARRKAADLDEREVPRRVPTAVVWEVYTGVGNVSEKSERATLRRGYRRLLQSLPVVGLDDDLARRAGTLRGKHLASDRVSALDGADSIVAAIGLAFDEPVVSNDSDFRDVEGLTVETY